MIYKAKLLTWYLYNIIAIEVLIIIYKSKILIQYQNREHAQLFKTPSNATDY